MPRTISLTLLAIALAAAEESPTIIVTAERGEGPVSEAPVATAVVTADDIQERGGAVNATDWLRDIIGVGLWNTNGGVDGGSVTVRLRGLDQKYTQYRIDNIPFEDQGSVDGTPRPVFLQPAGLRSVELAKGPQSGLYGSGAVGGVIEFQTARPTKRPEATASLTVGSFDSLGGSATATGPLGGSAGFAAAVSGFSSSGFSSITTDPDGNPQGFEDDSVQRYAGTLRLEAYPSEHAKLYVTGTSMRAKQEFDDAFAANPPDDTLSENFYRTWRLAAGGSLRDADRVEVDVDAAITDIQNTVTSAFSYALDSRQYYGSGRAKVASANGIAGTVGIDARRDEAYADQGSAANLVGTYAQAAYDHDSVYLSATGRYDHHSEFDGHTTWRIAGSWQPFDAELKLRGAAATGFRAPSLYQTYGDGVFVVTNPDLQPESSKSFEAGCDARLLGLVDIETTVFRTDVRDLIDFQTNRYVNLPGHTSSLGAEAGASIVEAVSTSIMVGAHAGYTYLDSTTASGEQAPYAPRHAGSVRLGCDEKVGGDLTLRQSIAVRRTTGYQADATGTAPVEGATVADAVLGLVIGSHWDVAVRIDNLFDESYVMNRSFGTTYATAPRSYWLTVTGKF